MHLPLDVNQRDALALLKIVDVVVLATACGALFAIDIEFNMTAGLQGANLKDLRALATHDLSNLAPARPGANLPLIEALHALEVLHPRTIILDVQHRCVDRVGRSLHALLKLKCNRHTDLSESQ